MSFTSTARALLNGAPFVLSKCALAFSTCIELLRSLVAFLEFRLSASESPKSLLTCFRF